MSDTPQGPGWWQASDDKWYPPPRPAMPGEDTAPATAVAPTTAAPTAPAPTYGAPGSGGFPAGPPTAVSGGYAPPGAPGAPGAPGGPGSFGGPGGPGGPSSMPGAAPSPYGMPPATAPGSGQNHTPLYIVIGVVVAAALVGLILLLTGGDDEPTANPGTTTTSGQGPATTGGQGPATTVATPTTAGGGGGGGQPSADDIEVIESGFSVYTDQLAEEQRVSYGLIVQNNGDQVATGIQINVGFKDAAGTVVGSADQTIGVLLPGQKMGIGDEPYDIGADPAEMQVTVGNPQSLESPDNYGEITVSGISTSIDDYGAPTTNFTAGSTYTDQIDSPYPYAIYRNAGGDIVGGSYGLMNFLPANGNTAGEVTSYTSIPDIDTSKTEVYLDPGYLF